MVRKKKYKVRNEAASAHVESAQILSIGKYFLVFSNISSYILEGVIPLFKESLDASLFLFYSQRLRLVIETLNVSEHYEWVNLYESIAMLQVRFLEYFSF